MEQLIELKAEIGEPMRVDVYLAEELEWASRSTVQKWIKEGCVKLRGKVCTKPGKKVFPGEELSLVVPPEEPSEITPEEIPLDIVYEDDYLAVVGCSIILSTCLQWILSGRVSSIGWIRRRQGF